MKSYFLSLVTAVALSAPSMAVAVWGQCGGINYSGSTTCDSGSVCTKLNDWYYQCLPGSTTQPPTTQPPTTQPPTTTTPPTTQPPTTTTDTPGPSNSLCGAGGLTKFKYFGVNEAGAEFGQNTIPGVLGTDYTWPSPSSVDYFIGGGFNTFRIAFLMERLSPPSGGLTGPFDQTYLNGLKTIVSYVTGKGGYAVIDPHNFMIYNGAGITSTSNFKTWWKNLATVFKSDSRVIFDVMNEPHDIPAQTAFNLNQAAVDGIRESGATQLILVEGTSWSGAWTWTTTSGNSQVFGAINDPLKNTAIEMHQYLDSDGSGTSPTCVSSTIGAERLQAATQWLQQTGLKGFLGEMGAGSNPACISAIQGAICHMQKSSVWIGFLYWSAGPWWGDYFQSIEPPNGASISQVLPQALKPFV